MRGRFGDTSALHAAAIASVCDEHCLQISRRSQGSQVLFRYGQKIALPVQHLVTTVLTGHLFETIAFL
jgi:hypothetical protein